MKIYLCNFNGILDGLVGKIGKDLTSDWKEADVLVLWQDGIGELEDVATQAKMMGKKVIVAEHGWLAGSDYFQPNGRTLVADKFMTWGNWPKKLLIEKAGIEL